MVYIVQLQLCPDNGKNSMNYECIRFKSPEAAIEFAHLYVGCEDMVSIYVYESDDKRPIERKRTIYGASNAFHWKECGFTDEAKRIIESLQD